MSACGICLGDAPGGITHHPKCLRELFGRAFVPAIDVELAKLHTAALAMVGHTSLSGVQRKVSVRLAAERATLQVAAEGGRYILKPQAQIFPSLPENEHVTMRLAELAGLIIPAGGLFALADGSVGYLVKRFDRLEGGGKLLQEDFCQLAGRSPKDKYTGSAELCARLVLRHASEPLVEVLKLYRLIVFGWWTGNGDMHLKNFSLLRGEDGRYRLSPAYDLLSTRLVIPDDQLALPVAGNRKNVTRRQWLKLAEQSELPVRAAERVLREIADVEGDALTLVSRSELPDDMKQTYRALLEKRSRALRPAHSG